MDNFSISVVTMATIVAIIYHIYDYTHPNIKKIKND